MTTISIFVLSIEEVFDVKVNYIPRIGETIIFYDSKGNNIIAKVLDVVHEIKGDKSKYVEDIRLTVN